MTDRIVASIPKNSREALHIGLGQFNGYDLVSVRVYAPGREGTELVPTKAGIALQVAKLPDLIRALQEAERIARMEGIL